MKLLASIVAAFLPYSSGVTQQSESDAAKLLIDTLQFLSPMSSGFKYDRYGCHCFQHGLEKVDFGGKGPALDEVDRACHKYHQCQRCLTIDKGAECSHLAAFDVNYNEDPLTMEREAVCKNPKGSCERNLCECTIAFANSMAKAEESDSWDVNLSKYAMNQSYRDECNGGAPGLAKARLLKPKISLKSASGSSDEKCCGSYSEHRFPYESVTRGCCGGKTYDQKWLKCCNGKIKPISADC